MCSKAGQGKNLPHLKGRELVHKHWLIIYFTTVGLLTLFTGVTGVPTPAQVPVEAPKIERTVEEVKQSPEDFVDTESYIRHYFADLPVLVDVAFCESTFRQHDEDGKVLRGKVNNSDVGVMQINLYYHGDHAETLGYDLHTLEGNAAFARNLYERQGANPWVHSSDCWEQQPVSTLAYNK